MEKYVVVMLAGMAKELGGKAIAMMLSVGNFSKRCDWPQMVPVAGYNESELTSPLQSCICCYKVAMKIDYYQFLT